MDKSKRDHGVDDFQEYDEFEDEEFGFEEGEADESDEDGRHRNRPARERLESRREQKFLREQLFDWDDYGDEFHDD